ncbi:MAG: hypothetical protein QMD01_09205 [Thermodesulfovibrionales bacterium]|nr:hypothetical protein [Thermodesulfovibrionales bacterium]
MKKAMFLVFIISCFVLAQNYVFAATGTVRDIISEKYASKKDICPVIKDTIKEGINTQEIVRTSIQMGYTACYVIKCAIIGGGNIEHIIYGAIEAGVTRDVVSRCSMEAGARPEDILPGLGYTPPSAPLTPITINFPGGGTFSPSVP